jgi:uncharacterized protein (DUF305 family)
MALLSRAFIRKRMISLAATASVTATSFALADDPTKIHHPRRAVSIQYAADQPDHSDEQPFLSESGAAAKEMIADMTIKPTSEVDRDFVAMMVPPPQGALDMAKAQPKYGHNEQLRRLIQEIVAKQQQEVKMMRDAVAVGKTSAAQSPDQSRAQMPTRAVPIDGSISADGMNVYR